MTSQQSKGPSAKILQIIHAGEDVEKGSLLHRGWECKLVQSQRQRMEGPQETKNRVSIWSGSPTPGPIPGQNSHSERHMHPTSAVAPAAITKPRKRPECPSTGEWTKKLWYKHTAKCPSAIKEIEVMPFAATDRPRDDHCSHGQT